MFFLRIVAVLGVLALLASLGLYLFKRDRRYLGWAWRILQFSVAAAIVVLALYTLERLIVIL